MKTNYFFSLILFSALFAIYSCGSEQYEGSKSEWLQDAFDAIEANPEIKAISYWNENWEDKKPVEMVINSSADGLMTYTNNVSGDEYVTEIILEDGKVVAPEEGIYHSAYPGFSILNGTEEEVTANKIEAFVDMAGKDLAWVYFSNSWHEGISFPAEEVNTIYNAGYLPLIRMLPWSEIAPHIAKADDVYSMQKFIDGVFDTELIQWAADLKAFGHPVMLEFGTEVNGNWMPWNGEWNGGGETDNYGDPALADGPERFRDAFRHIINLFEEQEVDSVTWVFHVNFSNTPDEEWNEIKNYYPGDDYIDWLGVSIYGPMYEDQKWTYAFSDMYNYVKPKLEATSTKKPVAILEFGVGETTVE